MQKYFMFLLMSGSAFGTGGGTKIAAFDMTSAQNLVKAMEQNSNATKSLIKAMEQNEKIKLEIEKNEAIYSIILPGQNGKGGDSHRANEIIKGGHLSKKKKCETLSSWKIDFGQDNCIQHFHEQLLKTEDIKDRNLILHGVSQGTATIINGFNMLPENIKKNVKCITLEAVLGTGNSAIVHTIKQMVSSKITYVPFFRYWMPGVAKIIFPTYNPLGKQALYCAKDLPKYLPVIILHHKNDPQLSVNDARRLYCVLKQQKNDNVFLFEAESDNLEHFDVLSSDHDRTTKIKAIQAIYKKFNLPYNQELLPENEAVNLKEFQPDVETMQKRIAVTDQQWRSHNIIDRATFVGLVAYGLHYAYSKLYRPRP